MKTYTCLECGNEFKKSELDLEGFSEGEYYCKSCSEFLMESGRDAVDPNHDYSSFSDWEENGG